MTSDEDDTAPAVIAWRLKSIERVLSDIVRKLENLPADRHRIDKVEQRLVLVENDRKTGLRWGITTVIATLALLGSVAIGIIAIVKG